MLVCSVTSPQLPSLLTHYLIKLTKQLVWQAWDNKLGEVCQLAVLCQASHFFQQIPYPAYISTFLNSSNNNNIIILRHGQAPKQTESSSSRSRSHIVKYETGQYPLCLRCLALGSTVRLIQSGHVISLLLWSSHVNRLNTCHNKQTTAPSAN